MLRRPSIERAVRIAFAIGERVMLAMAGDPFLGDDGGREPQPEPHRQRGEIVQPHTAVSLRAVKEQRDAHVREVTRDTTNRIGIHHRAAQPPKSWHCRTPKIRRKCHPPIPLKSNARPGYAATETDLP